METDKKSLRDEALAYHAEGRPGKIEVIPTKPYSTQKDLSLAYSPGVAEPCLEIEKNPDNAYKYTDKGNLVAVISNGTAVLGLGDIGAQAGKPVMEGKGLLFKTFADIDVFDIEVDTKDTEKFIETVKNISVTFGGINLEDIKAPECFVIEERLKEELSIPVMHDDQHGTAIISAAALLNALEITGKKIGKVKVVVNGAGAAAVSCAKLYIALANPNPEIRYEVAHAARPDIIFATGRSDYPNQVNNVLGFPYIFRGALDVRATKINEEMKIAAVRALAELTKEPVPDMVAAAYNDNNITFGREYLIPKALDPRLITRISMAVAKAAIESGVARKTITDWDAYSQELENRMGRDDKLMRSIRSMARTATPRRLVFSEGDSLNTIKAAIHLLSDGIATPILIGSRSKIHALLDEHKLSLDDKYILDFRSDEEEPRRQRYATLLYSKMSRKGINHAEALKYMMQRDWFTLMMVASGDADTSLLGFGHSYIQSLEPVRQVFGLQPSNRLATMQIVTTKRGPMFFADTAVIPSPSAEDLAEIALMAAKTVRRFGIEPVIAMLSYSNFGTDEEPLALKVTKAVEILHNQYPELLVEGEMKADIALDRESRAHLYPFNKLGDREVNTFIFPNLSAANISYKLVEMLGGAEINGPILMGLSRANVHLVSETASVRTLINLGMIAAAEATPAK